MIGKLGCSSFIVAIFSVMMRQGFSDLGYESLAKAMETLFLTAGFVTSACVVAWVWLDDCSCSHHDDL